MFRRDKTKEEEAMEGKIAEDMARLKRQREALEREERMLSRQRRIEEEERQRKLAEDMERLQGQREALERERMINKQKKREEERQRMLTEDQQRMRKELALPSIQGRIVEDNIYGSLPYTQSFQFPRTVERVSLSTNHRPNDPEVVGAEGGMTVKEKSISELQEQMNSLQREIASRQEADISLLDYPELLDYEEDFYNEYIYENGSEHKQEDNKRFQKDEQERRENVRQSKDGNSQAEEKVYDNSRLNLPRKIHYLEKNRVEDTKESTRSEEIPLKKESFKEKEIRGKSQTEYSELSFAYEDRPRLNKTSEIEKDRTKTEPDMIKIIDREISEIDKRLQQLREESYLYKKSQGVDRNEDWEAKESKKGPISHRKDFTKFEEIDFEPSTLNREVMDHMRSTPIYSREQTVGEGVENSRYQISRVRYDENNDRSESDIRRSHDKSMIDKDRRNISHPIGFENIESKSYKSDLTKPELRSDRRDDFTRERFEGDLRPTEYDGKSHSDLLKAKYMLELQKQENQKHREEMIKRQEDELKKKETDFIIICACH